MSNVKTEPFNGQACRDWAAKKGITLREIDTELGYANGVTNACCRNVISVPMHKLLVATYNLPQDAFLTKEDAPAKVPEPAVDYSELMKEVKAINESLVTMGKILATIMEELQ